MSEKELNSYRFLSGEEPTDEMLNRIMEDALQVAMARKQQADAKIKIEFERQRQLHRKKWSDRLNSIANGRLT